MEVTLLIGDIKITSAFFVMILKCVLLCICESCVKD